MSTNNTASPVNDPFVPLLGSTDWGQEWTQLQRLRRRTDDSTFWNKRSKDFDRPDKTSPYVAAFIEKCNIQPGERVLDMGCGTGSIAVPLALAGHHVIAADFSEGMIEQAKFRCDAAQVDVETKIMAWEDDWDTCGVTPQSVDVALASRSLSVSDLTQALTKLSRTAARHCCISVSCGCSPRMDERILAVCGLTNTHGKDFQYAWNILVGLGYQPSCSFIYSARKDTFATFDDALADFGRMINDVAHLYPAGDIERAHEKLAIWLRDNLVANEDEGKTDEKGYPEGALRLQQPRIVPWAFISWDV